MLVSYRALVAYLPYGFWKRKLLVAQAKPAFADFDIKDADKVLRAFNIALKNLKLSTTCLQRSMALQSMLRHRNVPAHVVIGVARNQRFPECHAWVEANGRILFEDPRISSEYLPFLTDKSNKTDP